MFRQIPELSRKVVVTPELAVEFSSTGGGLKRFEHERSLNQKRGGEILNAIKSGRILEFNWAVAHLGGERFRVNGQHSSWALARAHELGIFPSGVVASIAEYACETREDVATLWRSFDQKWSSRSAQDQVYAGTEGIAGSKRTKVLISSALVMSHSNGQRPAPPSPDERVTLLREAPAFCAFVADALNGNERGPLARVAIVAAMHRTWICDPALSAEFWRLVSDESHPSVTNPTRVLARMIRSEFAAGRNTDPELAKATFVRCLHAWNNWVDGEEISVLKYFKDSVPALRKPRRLMAVVG